MRWALANGYRDDLTIERGDNSGPYSPSNSRWATMKEQGRNKTNNRVLRAFGKTQCLAAWVEEYDMRYTTIRARLNRGWSAEDALATPSLGPGGKRALPLGNLSIVPSVERLGG